ncbi:MAG: hypothetical protein RL685_6175 [Pseudomonadota bacterium]
MKPSLRLIFSSAGLLATLYSVPVRAASQDAAAQELADKAIFTDYLQLDFKAAEKKLKKAIQLCETGTCSANVKAQVYRDLAVIYITGLKRSDAGHDLLVQALEIDSSVALDADLTTPELVRVFNAAKADVGRKGSKPKAAPADEPAPIPLSEDDEPRPKKGAKAKREAADESEPAPASLDDPASSGSVDCPPDFPGCETVSDEPKPEPEEEDDEKSEPDPELGILNWLSAALQQDFLMFSGETGVCGPGKPEELSCYRANDVFRPATPENTAGNGGSVAGGFRVATTRLLIGYDRILFPNISAGVRVGYAIGGGPSEPSGASFLPMHAELRGTYWFAPIQLGELRPYGTLGAGVAQVDGSVTTQVVDRCPSNMETPPCIEGQIAPPSRVTVWKKTGTTFASLGAGALYPLTEHSGINAELKAVLLFPSSGFTMSLQAGYTHGF